MSTEEDNKQTFGASKFNEASDILTMIGYLKSISIQHHSEGKILDWFNCWKQIKFILIGKLEDDEKKSYIKLESRIAFISRKNWENKETYRAILIRLIEIYIEKIQMQMEAWNMGLIAATDERKFA